MYYWPLQEAKARLSELMRLTLKEGPQGISLRGQREVVVMSQKTYEKLQGHKPTFLNFINESPIKNLDLDLERDKSFCREIDL